MLVDRQLTQMINGDISRQIRAPFKQLNIWRILSKSCTIFYCPQLYFLNNILNVLVPGRAATAFRIFASTFRIRRGRALPLT
jgi:hypothetical protein